MATLKRWTLPITLILLVMQGFVIFSPSAFAVEKVGDYPSQPITLVCPFAVGAGADYFSRLMASALSRVAGVPINVVNMDGAGGEDAVDYVLMQPADGYTLYLLNATRALFEAFGRTRTDFLKEFVPVVKMAEESDTIWIRGNDTRFSDFESFVEYIKSHPGEVTIGGGSVGGMSQTSIARMALVADLDLVYVPAGKDRVANVLGGHIDALIDKPGPHRALHETGQLKCIVSLGNERAMPDVPTLRECGIDVGITDWRALTVKRGTPEPILKYIEALVEEALQDESLITMLRTDYIQPAFDTGDNVVTLYLEELAAFKRVAELSE